MRQHTRDILLGLAGGLLAAMLIVAVALLPGCATQPATVPPTAKTITVGATASLGFLIPLATLGVGLGVAAIFAGLPKIGIPAIGGCLASLVLTLMTMRYAAWIAAGAALVVLGSLAWLAVSKYKTVTTALSEVVAGVQKVKNAYLPSVRTEANAILAGAQSIETQELVQKIKESTT